MVNWFLAILALAAWSSAVLWYTYPMIFGAWRRRKKRLGR